MGIALKFDLKTDNGKDVSVMSQIIQKRTQELGETTSQSCVAMTINVLRSFRTDTRQAKLNEKTNITVKDVSDLYYPSFSKSGKGSKAQRCLRSGKNGNRINPANVKWICSNYYKGQNVYTYHITDTISQDKQYEYLLVADNEKQANDYAKNRHKNRIKRNRNLAKYALGVAMHKVYTNQAIPNDEVNESSTKIAQNETTATISNSGYGSGNLNIHVDDNLKYATDALKSGDANTIIDKSLNKMIGYINHRLHQKGIYDDLTIPTRDMINQ